MEALARAHDVDLVLNAVDPRFVMPVFRGALANRRYGLPAVAWQTGFNPVVAMELLATGAWKGAGVLSNESFDPDPYLAILDRDGIHHAIMEIEPGKATA